MFLEKFSRFFRVYDLSFHPRHKNAAYLPLDADDKNYSVRDALQQHIDSEKALEVQANGDIVELMEVKYRPSEKALVLLFHRASPNAAEPAYRKKARARAGKKVTIRTVTKQDGEEQSVSAHLTIKIDPIKKGVYRAILEEIPGISMGITRQIIAKALFDYPYTFRRSGKELDTYTVIKAEGLKSETMENALKEGHINFITLVRPAEPEFVDSRGMFEPTTETMRIRVRQEIDGKSFRETVAGLFSKAKEAGWQQFNVDVEFDDRRRRTVKLEKDQEAKEILFVRSELASFSRELPVCTDSIIPEVVQKAMSIAKAK